MLAKFNLFGLKTDPAKQYTRFKESESNQNKLNRFTSCRREGEGVRGSYPGKVLFNWVLKYVKSDSTDRDCRLFYF